MAALCESAASRFSVALASGFAISARNFRLNAAHCLSVVACCPSFSVAGLGDSVGNQTS